MEKRFRPLYVVPTSAFGGVETFIRQTALFHNTQNFKPIYCFFKEGPLTSWIQTHSQHDIYICPIHFKLRNPISVLRTIFWLHKIIQKAQPHLIHSTMAYAALIGSIAARFTHTPHLWFQHGPVSGWMDFLAGCLPSQAILYNSNYTRECQKNVMRRFRIGHLCFESKKNIVLYLGSNERPSKNKTERQTSSAIQIGMLCRFQRWKGVHIFLKAIHLLVNDIVPGSIQVRLWGGAGSGEQQTDYENSIQSLSKLDFIEVNPPTSNPQDAIDNLDILVNASITPEPFGLTIVEAMHAGVVPIAPKAGGPLEIIQDGTDGLLFEPGNEQDLALKIKQLLYDEKFRKALAHAAKKKAQNNFSALNSIKNLESIYLSTSRSF